jgi:hypothetical protein
MKTRSDTGSLISRLSRLFRRWFGFSFDLTGLAVNDHEIMLDLAAGRD